MLSLWKLKTGQSTTENQEEILKYKIKLSASEMEGNFLAIHTHSYMCLGFFVCFLQNIWEDPFKILQNSNF